MEIYPNAPDSELHVELKKQAKLDIVQGAAWDALADGASRREAGRAANVSASTVCNWVKRWRRAVAVDELFATAHDATAAELLGARWSEARVQTAAEAASASFIALETAEHALCKVSGAENAADAKRWADVARGCSITFGILVDKADQLAVPLEGAEPELTHKEAKAQVMELVEKLQARRAVAASKLP